MTEWRQVPENEVVRDLGVAAGNPHELDMDEGAEPQVFVVPAEYAIQVVDPNDYTDTPRRQATLNLSAFDTESFINLVNSHTRGGVARVYADPVAYAVTAVVNDDARRDRRIKLTLKHTRQWTEWIEQNDKLMGQHAFVEFVEDHLADIAEPAAADLLEMAQTLEATSSAQFKSAVRLSSGTRKFMYDETVEARAGQSGEFEVPDEFTVALTPWVGFDGIPHALTAKLRYRISQSGLALGYHLIGWEETLDAAFRTSVVDPIKAADLWTVLGAP